MSSQRKLGLFLQLNFFTNDLIDKSNKKSFDKKLNWFLFWSDFWLRDYEMFCWKSNVPDSSSLAISKKKNPLHLFIFSQKSI